MLISSFVAVGFLTLASAQRISTDATCGGTKGYTCLNSQFGNCCSVNGWCGSTAAYCSTGCQSKYGSCGTSPQPKRVSPDGTCGAASGYTCLNSAYGNCCSQYNYCGSANAYCRASSGCQSAFGTCSGVASSSIAGAPSTLSTSTRQPSSIPSTSTSTSARGSTTPSQAVSTNGRCGSDFGGRTCLGSQYGNCCSQYSYCGSTEDYCASAKKCQAVFGLCTSSSSSSSRSASRSSMSSSSSTRSSSVSSTVSSSVSRSSSVSSGSSVQSTPSSSMSSSLYSSALSSSLASVSSSASSTQLSPVSTLQSSSSALVSSTPTPSTPLSPSSLSATSSSASPAATCSCFTLTGRGPAHINGKLLGSKERYSSPLFGLPDYPTSTFKIDARGQVSIVSDMNKGNVMQNGNTDPGFLSFSVINSGTATWPKAVCTMDSVTGNLACCLGSTCGFYATAEYTDDEGQIDDRSYAAFLGFDRDYYNIPMTMQYNCVSCPTAS